MYFFPAAAGYNSSKSIIHSGAFYKALFGAERDHKLCLK